jgi:hypothetical protein
MKKSTKLDASVDDHKVCFFIRYKLKTIYT